MDINNEFDTSPTNDKKNCLSNIFCGNNWIIIIIIAVIILFCCCSNKDKNNKTKLNCNID